MNDRKLLEQALEVLELPCDRWNCTQSKIVNRATIALRERLAQQEPRNQCGETCERAKLCAVCLAEMGAQPEQKPVTAQHRFRHPQKTMPDWSVWQECRVSNRPAWEIDSQGYEVEYRNLYAAPQQREWQGLTDEESNRLVMEHLGPHALTGGKMSVYDAFLLAIRATEAKLKEKND